MRPNVIIELKPYLHDYLYHEFGCRPTDEGVNVTAANDIGKFIQAMVTVTDRPPKQAIKEHPITLYLPIQDGTILSAGELHLYTGMETAYAPELYRSLFPHTCSGILCCWL